MINIIVLHSIARICDYTMRETWPNLNQKGSANELKKCDLPCCLHPNQVIESEYIQLYRLMHAQTERKRKEDKPACQLPKLLDSLVVYISLSTSHTYR